MFHLTKTRSSGRPRGLIMSRCDLEMQMYADTRVRQACLFTTVEMASGSV